MGEPTGSEDVKLSLREEDQEELEPSVGPHLHPVPWGCVSSFIPDWGFWVFFFFFPRCLLVVIP